MIAQDGTYVTTGKGVEFLPGVHLNSGWSMPKKRGEMTAEEIIKWWTPCGEEPERKAAILEVLSNEDTWDAYTLPIEDPFFDRWRGITKRQLRKKAMDYFKKHFLQED